MRKFTKPDLPREYERRFWQGIRAGLSVREAAESAGASLHWGWRRLVEAGSWQAARSAGLIRAEGKGYVMRPNDVVEFRFNV